MSGLSFFKSRSVPAVQWLPATPLAIGATVQAVEVTFKRVADGVYACIGDTDGRTYDNEGLNANIGLVVTPAGAVLPEMARE